MKRILLFIVCLMTSVSIYAQERVYSCAYDGFVNIRQQPTNQSAKLGQFRNGPDGATLLEDLGTWMKICTADGITGYVLSRYVQYTPTVAYTGRVSANWVEGIWPVGFEISIYNNGYWETGNDWCFAKGYWIMQNNEVKLVTVLQLNDNYQWVKVDTESSENIQILEIDEYAKTLGGVKKSYLPSTYNGYREGGYPGIYSLTELRAHGKSVGAEVRKAMGR